MRSFLVTLGAGLALLVAAGLTQRSALVYTPGVAPISRVVQLGAGRQTCQRPIVLPTGARFERVRVFAGGAAPGPPLEVTVEAARTLGRGRLAGGYRAGRRPAALAAPVGEIGSGAPLAVCVRNVGAGRATLWGSNAGASTATDARLDGKPARYDLSVRLERDRPRSLLAQLPAVADRAALFKARWATPAVLAVLALLVLIGVPALCVTVLRRALSSPTPARTAAERRPVAR